MTAPKPAAAAETQLIATKLTITTDSSVVGPDGKFTATVITVDGGNQTLDRPIHFYQVAFAIDGTAYWACDNLTFDADGKTAVCETAHDLTSGSHTITASFTSIPILGAPLDYSSSTDTIQYAPNCRGGDHR